MCILPGHALAIVGAISFSNIKSISLPLIPFRRVVCTGEEFKPCYERLSPYMDTRSAR
jgi:hypothetical protein